MILKNKNPHKRDESIVFDEIPHIYYINGSCEGYTSVTTLVHEYFPKFDADIIIGKMMKSKKWSNSKYFGMSPDEIKLSWKENRDAAATAGTKMHLDIEYFYNKMELENSSQEFHYFLNFYRDFKHLIPYRTEWEVYDEELLLAGSIDMLYKDERTGELLIYDWKRSKAIKEDNIFDSGFSPLEHLPNANFWHYALQLNIYKAILEKNYGEKIQGMCLLWLHPNNEGYIRLEVPDLSREVKQIFAKRIQNA